MDVCLAKREDIGLWMELVRRVRWNFPGLETEKALEEHRSTVLRFMKEDRALCVRGEGRLSGILLFSRKRNMICFLAVAPQSRRKGIGAALLERALQEMDPARPVTVATFRRDDPKGEAPRALYEKFSFVPQELMEEYGYPLQMFVLRRCL